MSRKQSAYLEGLLGDDEETVATPRRPSTLLSRDTALARLATGEVRQVTELRLDPARCRIWAGNGRHYAELTETRCRDLIDSIIAEGGQKVPAVVRRVKDDPEHEFEVLAGTRRHWSVSWLRKNNYPDVTFLAHVHELDDEAAFRLADIENRARADLSDLERARNYRAGLQAYYGGVQARMAERLKISKGWLSKLLSLADLPDEVVAAFGSPADVQIKGGYELAQKISDAKARARLIKAAAPVAAEQQARRATSREPLPAAEVVRRILANFAARVPTAPLALPVIQSKLGRPIVSVVRTDRQGVTLRLHAASGADHVEVTKAVAEALEALAHLGRGLQR